MIPKLFSRIIKVSKINLEKEQKELYQNVALLISEISDRQKVKEAFQASQRFTEFFYKLSLRYKELKEIECEILSFSKSKRSLSEKQNNFVHKTEDFHQQLYATTSSFIKLLSHIAPQDFKRRMPSIKVSKFLDYLEKENKEIKDSIKIIKKSIEEYRVNYIDHINQNQSYDWYTLSILNKKKKKVYIVYFREKEKGGSFINIANFVESQNKILTPFKVENVFVPPHHIYVFENFILIIKKTLIFLNNLNHV